MKRITWKGSHKKDDMKRIDIIDIVATFPKRENRLLVKGRTDGQRFIGTLLLYFCSLREGKRKRHK